MIITKSEIIKHEWADEFCVITYFNERQMYCQISVYFCQRQVWNSVASVTDWPTNVLSERNNFYRKFLCFRVPVYITISVQGVFNYKRVAPNSEQRSTPPAKFHLFLIEALNSYIQPRDISKMSVWAKYKISPAKRSCGRRNFDCCKNSRPWEILKIQMVRTNTTGELPLGTPRPFPPLLKKSTNHTSLRYTSYI